MNRRWLLAILGAVAFGVLLTWVPLRTGGGSSDDDTSAAGGRAGQSAGCGPNATAANLDFTIRDMDGKDVRLAEFKGKVVLLNFWATWCSPCLSEIPGFVELQAKYRGQGLVIVGISVDDPIEALKPFAQALHMNYPVLAGADHTEVQEAYGPMYGIPVSVLISRNGLICKRFIGPASKQQFEREIRALL